jgi:hypothetical protein
MFQRSLKITDITEQKSLFLLGPRQTGKSTLLRLMLPNALYIDLLSPPLFRELAAHPENLEDMAGKNIVAIEVKGTAHPDAADFKGLRAFAEEFPSSRKILVCDCAIRKRLADGIEIIPAAEFFTDLWAQKIIF